MNKFFLLVAMTALLAVISAQGALFTETFNSGSSVGTVPDGAPTGVAFRGIVNDIPSGFTVSGLTVGLNISGGYNGDLYAYLVAPNGSLVVLMNQPGVGVNGFGASGAGMNITLLDGAYPSIQNETSGSILSGSYNAAGSLADFSGLAANGTWTLFFADLSSGGGTSILNSWSLDITAVPEPVNAALAIISLMAVSGIGVRRLIASRKNTLQQDYKQSQIAAHVVNHLLPRSLEVSFLPDKGFSDL